jgi:hypothetical protein
MATVLKIDSLNIADGTNYESLLADDWSEPPLNTDTQPFLQSHGGAIVTGSDYYGLAVRRCTVLVKGTDRATFHTNMAALQKKILKRNIVLEFRYDGATNSNYSDVLFCRSKVLDDGQIIWNNNAARIELTFVCKPGWRPAAKTSRAVATTLDSNDIAGQIDTGFQLWVDPAATFRYLYVGVHPWLDNSVANSFPNMDMTNNLTNPTTVGTSYVDVFSKTSYFDLADMWGRYRVLVPIKSTDTGQTVARWYIYDQTLAASISKGPATNLTITSDWQWLDLGIIQWPPSPVVNDTMKEAAFLNQTINMHIEAKCSAAGKSVSVGTARLVPIDGGSVYVDCGAAVGALMLDFTDDIAITTAAAGSNNRPIVWPGTTMGYKVISGSVPRISPQTKSDIYVLAFPLIKDAVQANMDAVALTTSLRFDYYPRYLSPVI